MSKRKQPATKTTPTTSSSSSGQAGQAEAGQVDQVDAYPLSRRATIDDLRAAGIRNGMTADEVETALARVMR